MYSEPGRGPGLSLTRYMSSAGDIQRVTTYKMQRPKTFPPLSLSLSLSLSGLECRAVSRLLTGKLVWEPIFAAVVLLLCLSVADGLL